ncbi:hypothetical protein [Mesorhizobium sp. M0006]|uniref:hypothetical protein n=1 Tax=Mesorhizobium sp. M0006 TaxID=2956838 RepID=UPI00333A2CA2
MSALLSVQDLGVRFRTITAGTADRFIDTVCGLSFEIRKGETLALSAKVDLGKSTIASTHRPSAGCWQQPAVAAWSFRYLPGKRSNRAATLHHSKRRDPRWSGAQRQSHPAVRDAVDLLWRIRIARQFRDDGAASVGSGGAARRPVRREGRSLT